MASEKIDKRTYGAVSTEDNQNSTDSDSSVIMSNPAETGDAIREHGLNVLCTAIFVAAEMAGTGILALPRAVVNFGWIGVVLTVIFCVNAAYGGSRLGDCWSMLEQRYPEYREGTRNPYPLIAYHAFGTWARYLVSFCIQLTLFGAGTVYLLLVSKIMQQLVAEYLPIHVGFCVWFVVFAIALCIPMWLGSPKDFWFVGMGALFTTVLSCIFILIQLIIDMSVRRDLPTPRVSHSYQELFMSFGTVLFSFGGASTFPTIQNDMKNRNHFYKSVRIAFVVILLLYLPIATLAYYTYGEYVTPNVIDTLTESVFTVLANVCMASHLVLAFIIIINPVSQDLEEIFKIPNEFGVKRCVLRTLILCFMVFIGLTIPKFDNVLSLVGGSTITLSTFVFPPLFYMKLCDQRSEHWSITQIPMHMRTYMWELIAIGVVGGIASTYSAILKIVEDPFSQPCYF